MLDAWLQLDSPLVYEKELLPVGKLTKWVDGAKKVLDADITRPFLDNIVDQFRRFKSVGVRVPVFKTHKEDPDNKRGQVQDLFVKKNSKGEDSLFGKMEFDNKEAVQLATTNDVSVLVPPKFVDGRGNKYQWPLRHVAITSTPVLPGLDGWNGPVVLSFEDIGDTAVELKPLFEELSLDYDENSSLELALEAVRTLKAELGTCQAELKLALEETPGEELVLSFPPVLMKNFRNSREAQVKALMTGDKPVFSPAMGKKIIDKYCSESVLRLDLSSDNEETEFDRTLELAQEIAKDRVLPNSGRKVIKLSNDSEANPVVAGAKRRAEAAKPAAR